MEVVQGLRDVRTPPAGTVLTIGTFDAVHRGHQVLLAHVVEQARGLGAEPALVTFRRHPMEVLVPDRAPCRLGQLDQRLERFRLAGISLVLVVDFSVEFSELEPEDFVSGVLVDALDAREVVVGEDFRFGHRRRGDVRLLTELGEAHGFEVTAHELVAAGAEPISSTEIRRLVLEGEVERAAGLLGRSYRLAGVVEHGAGRGGKDLGFPTANLRPDPNACLPGVGVYAGRWVWRSERLPGMINVGYRPTFTPAPEPVTEIHVFDLEADLYGERGEIEFAARLRDEVRFDSVEALVEQMHRDAVDTRAALRRVEGT